MELVLPMSPKKITTLDALARMMAQGFEEMGMRFDRHDERFEKIENRLSGVEGRLDGIEERLLNVENKTQFLQDSFNDFKIETRISFKKIEVRVNHITNE